MKKNKHAESDYTYSQLPHNRKEVFFDKLKTQYRMIFNLGLITLLFIIPLIVSIVFKDTIKLSLIGDDGYISNEDLYGVNIYFSLIEIIPLIILSIGLAGIFRVIRLLIFDEIIFFKEDFFKGIKNNGKSFCKAAILIGILNVISNLSINLDINVIVRYIPLGIFLMVFLPIIFITLSFNNLYNVTYSQSIKNATYLFIKTFIITFLFYLLVFTNILIFFIPYLVFKYIVITIFSVFVTPILIMIWTLYMNKVFDKYINLEQYPEIYEKGIYKNEKN